MGLDINVSLLLGVFYNDVVEEKEEFQQVTKYHPDTGQPYQYNKKLSDVYHMGGNCFNNKWELTDLLEENELYLFEDYGLSIIGICVGDVGGGRISNGFSDPVTVQYVIDKQLEVSNSFAKLGVKDVIPRLFLWSRVSY